MWITQWTPIQYKKNTVTIEMGDGINTFRPPLSIADSEATDMRNVNSSKYPALNVRNGKTAYGTALSAISNLGQRNNQYIHIIDGTSWQYWSGTVWTPVGTVTAGIGLFNEFTTGTTKYTIFSNGVDRKAFDGTNVIDLTNAPLSKIFTAHKGRLYFALNNTVVFCAYNSINDYSTINDSGVNIVTDSRGSLTGLFTFNDKVVVFSEFSMKELYGKNPDTFELVDILGNIGCISNRSICTCGRKLYWMWYDGIYEYFGAKPTKVSEPFSDSESGDNGVKGGVTTFIKNINMTYKTGIVSGSIGDYLFTSIPYGSSATGNNLTLVFDVKLRKWYVRDEGFVDFETINNVLYGLDKNGKLWDMVATNTKDGTTAIDWYFITKAFNEGTPSAKVTVTEIWVTFDLPIGSTFSIDYSQSIDGADFVNLITLTPSADEQGQRIQLPITSLQNMNWYRLKLYGTGPCTIFYLEKKVRVKINNTV